MFITDLGNNALCFGGKGMTLYKNTHLMKEISDIRHNACWQWIEEKSIRKTDLTICKCLRYAFPSQSFYYMLVIMETLLFRNSGFANVGSST